MTFHMKCILLLAVPTPTLVSAIHMIQGLRQFYYSVIITLNLQSSAKHIIHINMYIIINCKDTRLCKNNTYMIQQV